MESLGNKLKTAREERGWSYDYVSRETNISTRYLESLEREDWKPTGDLEGWKSLLSKTATNTLTKNQQYVTGRLTEKQAQ